MPVPQSLARALWIALAVCVSAYLLYLLGRELDLEQLWLMIRRAPAGALAAALGLYALLGGWRALRFRLLHGQADLGLATLYPITLVHNLLVRTLPLRIGEVAYITLTRNHLGLSVGDSFGALVGARLFEAMLVVGVGATCLLLAHPGDIGRTTVIALGSAGLALCLAGLFLLAPLVRFLARILAWLVSEGRLTRGVGDRLEVAAVRLEGIRAPRVFAGSLLLSVCCYASGAGFNLVLLRSVAEGASVPLLLAVHSVVSLAAVIPLSVSGLGIVEGSWTYGLTALAGLELDRAVGISFFLHGCQLLSALVTGVAGYAALLLLEHGRPGR